MTVQPINRTLAGEAEKGILSLPISKTKESLIYIPKDYDHSTPAALALMLHGAGGVARHGLSYLQQYADANTMILVAPASREYSWDIIASQEFGPDVLLIDQALSYVFSHFSINPGRIAVGGFSDGASYALCLGLGNGDLFTHIIAFSPGFYYVLEKRGQPSIFITHGTDDDILPIEPCSRRIVRRLNSEGIAVQYKEFEGRHEITPAIANAAVQWFFSG